MSRGGATQRAPLWTSAERDSSCCSRPLFFLSFIDKVECRLLGYMCYICVVTVTEERTLSHRQIVAVALRPRAHRRASIRCANMPGCLSKKKN